MIYHDKPKGVWTSLMNVEVMKMGEEVSEG